jgi:hypothetical protein
MITEFGASQPLKLIIILNERRGNKLIDQSLFDQTFVIVIKQTLWP